MAQSKVNRWASVDFVLSCDKIKNADGTETKKEGYSLFKLKHMSYEGKKAYLNIFTNLNNIINTYFLSG